MRTRELVEQLDLGEVDLQGAGSDIPRQTEILRYQVLRTRYTCGSIIIMPREMVEMNSQVCRNEEQSDRKRWKLYDRIIDVVVIPSGTDKENFWSSVVPAVDPIERRVVEVAQGLRPNLADHVAQSKLDKCDT